MKDDITVVIPTIPTRVELLRRAVASVTAQTLQPKEVIVETDTERRGAPETRQRGLERVTTPWVAFLDDDDEFKPEHLAACLDAAKTSLADYVYPWFEVVGGIDPFPQFFGRPWNPEQPHQTTVVTLVRTALALEVGGFSAEAALLDPSLGHGTQEDWQFTLRVNAAGGKIYHLAQKTWYWHHHGGNTSGRPIY